MHRSPRPIEIDYRPLATHAEFRQCVEIQRVTWGEGFGEVVPAGLLTVVERTGGLVAGAFEGDRMVGFVCGFAAYRDGEPIQWSHMLAVRPEARGRGVGRALKLYQRQVALERGIRRIVWTFDPLQAMNAHLNVNRLGAHIIDYVPDMYGSDTGSPLHAGQATDRFVVEWRLAGARARRALEGRMPMPPASEGDVRRAPLLDLETLTEGGGNGDALPDPGAVRVAIPCDFIETIRRSPEVARRWRRATRGAFLYYLRRDYRVEAFHRREEGEPSPCSYYLARPGPPRGPAMPAQPGA